MAYTKRSSCRSFYTRFSRRARSLVYLQLDDTRWSLGCVFGKVLLGLAPSSCWSPLARLALIDRRFDRTSSAGCCISSSRASRRCDDASSAYADWRSVCTCSGIGDRRIYADRRTRSARVLPSCASVSTSSRRRNTGELDFQRCRDSSRPFSFGRSSWARRELFDRRPRDFPKDGSSRKNLKKTFVRWLEWRNGDRTLIFPSFLSWFMEPSGWPWNNPANRICPQIQIFCPEEIYLAEHRLRLICHTYKNVTFYSKDVGHNF